MNSADAARPPRGTETETEVEQALARAEALRREGRYAEGIALLQDALRSPVEKAQRAQIYFRMGNLYFDAGRIEDAEQAYLKAIAHDPLHISAHHNLGVVYRRQGRIAESIKMRKKANALARRHPERLKLAPHEIQRARRFARAWLLGGLIALALLLLLLLWAFG